MQTFVNIQDPLFTTLLVALIVWSVIWTGFALWRAARLGHKVWFVVMLVLNTAGILEIIYLFVITKKDAFQKDTFQEEAPASPEPTQ